MVSSQWTVVQLLIGLTVWLFGSCVSIGNNPRPGRPKTSTDERSMKLVKGTLEEDQCETCEKLSRAMGAKTLQKNAEEPTSVAHGWATHSP